MKKNTGESCSPWYNLTYHFDYSSDGDLCKVKREREALDGHVVETLEYDGKEFNYDITLNGKRIPNSYVEYKSLVKGKIAVVIHHDVEFSPEYKNDSLVHLHRKTITTYHSPNSIHTYEFIGGYESKEDWDEGGYKKWNKTFSFDLQNISTNNYPTDDFHLMDMKKSIIRFKDSKNIVYVPTRYNEVNFFVDHDNLFDEIRRKPYYRNWKYYEYENDLNVNLIPLSYIFVLGNSYENIESITEWTGFRSKNLIKYINVDNQEKRYEQKWTYERDMNGNISRVLIDDHTEFFIVCLTIDIDYVYE